MNKYLLTIPLRLWIYGCAVLLPAAASAATFEMSHNEILSRAGFDNYFLTLPEFTNFIADAQRITFEGAWLPQNTPNIETDSFFNVVPQIGSLYQPQGVLFDDPVAIHGGQTGFGWLTPYTVAGNTANGVGPIGLSFTTPGTTQTAAHESVMLSVADGPAGDFAVEFYNEGLLLATLIPQDVNNDVRSVFGYNDPRGITRVVVRQLFPDLDGGPDDIYIDDLLWGRIPGGGDGGGGPGEPIPEPATALLLGSGLFGVFTRRRSKQTAK